MLLKLALGATALSLAAPAFSQAAVDTSRMPVLASTTVLSISAEGRVERTPDVADLTAGVITQAATASEAMRSNAARMTEVTAALKRAGVSDRDIQTAGINLNPQYLYRENQPPQLTGYQAINNVSVRVRDLRNMGRTIDALVAQGANQINGPTFRVDKPEAELDRARQDAVRRAQARAQLYAAAAGLRVKRILQIIEGAPMTPPPYPVPVVRMDAASSKEASTPTAPGEIELTAMVNVVFELE